MAERAFAALLLAASLASNAMPCAAATIADGDSASSASDDSDSATPILARVARLLAAGRPGAARELLSRLPEAGNGGAERDFLDGMISYSGRDYRGAEAMFRRILDRDPRLLRVRLELARTLFMEKKDEQADYHFRLAAAEDPPAGVARNIVRFRQAIRARRSWRFNFNFGFAPDSNINSATDKESVDIYGLPFQLNPDGRAQSGTGHFVGADASIRLNRSGNVPVYIAGYGRLVRYGDARFDDTYAGAEAGPELDLAGGKLRATATAFMRWYGKRPLVTSFGTHLDYDRLIGDKWTLGGTLLVRHNDYSGRTDVDGWDAEGGVSASRPLGAATLGFGYFGVERNLAKDPGQAFWRGRMEVGVLKEVGWGLRPQITIVLARQVGDGPLAPFAEKRRDWLVQGSLSIYKRDWSFQGFAPSLSVTVTRNLSTLPLYAERRHRAEFRLTKAF